MANTTFSGPVRSQNGFQEWDGTEWVPIGGGGGGGASTTIYVDRSTSDPVIFLPAPSAVGHVYSCYFPLPDSFSGGAVVVRPVPAPGAPTSNVYVKGRVNVYATSGEATTVAVTTPDSSGSNAVKVQQVGFGGPEDPSDLTAFFQLVFVEIAGGSSYYQVMNSEYHSGNNNSRIISFS